MTEAEPGARLAVDIGGTFTDVAVARGAAAPHTAKVLTTPEAPERGVMAGIATALARAGLAPADLALVLHGTTLATNALIERKGAVTALITTDGFRDSVEMAYENRFEQYDIDMERPAPLVPRYLRLTVPERLSASGEVLRPLDEAAVEALLSVLDRHRVTSVAVGFLHSYANPRHERRVRDILLAARPELMITLSSEVSPEIREYERLSTACANAYVQPIMSGYLGRLARALEDEGIAAPLLLMTSGGGVTSLETAMRFPVRLVESGPAGGAILASRIAAECGLDQVLSFDMGGTTAKICLIDDGRPQTAHGFEVARIYRFLKGSGLPLRIPVIEMVEIGAGGGSIAAVDAMSRIAVGPESAGADPGPACYGRGGAEATVTDADLVLGRLDPETFAGGTLPLETGEAESALDRRVGQALGLSRPLAAFGVSEIVDENMANAARVHAIERGKDVARRAIVAFGGAAPAHAARLAQKLDIDTIVVPTGAGVGSAIGILRAPVSYQVVRSRYLRLGAFAPRAANELLAEMRAEAHAIVAQGAPGVPVSEERVAFMRYVGQGHEVEVPLPVRPFTDGDRAPLQAAFEEAYRALYRRAIPGLDVEVLSWAVTVRTEVVAPAAVAPPVLARRANSNGARALFDPIRGDFTSAAIHARAELEPGSGVAGPAVIWEDETSTVVPEGFEAVVNALGYLVLTRREKTGGAGS